MVQGWLGQSCDTRPTTFAGTGHQLALPSSGTNTLASCCLLSDTVVVAKSGKNRTNSKWQQDMGAVCHASVDTTQQHSDTSCVLYPEPATSQCHVTEL